MPKVWRSNKPGEQGTGLVFAGAVVQGTATLTANTTTLFAIGGFGRRCRFREFVVSVTTVPADADGTITAVVQKYDASADAAVALTTATDMETLTTREGRTVSAIGTLTDAQLTLEADDTLEFVVTNDSAAINTQPTNLVVRCLAFPLE